MAQRERPDAGVGAVVRILVACEFTGRVRDAFRRRGHDAYSCDLRPCEGDPTWHLQCDVREVLSERWDMLIAHPECTFLTNAGVRWLHTDIKRWFDLFEGADFFRLFLDAKHIPRRAVENPVMHKYALRLVGRRPDQVVQPWWFGDPFFKATGWWIEGLPLLTATNRLTPPPRGNGRAQGMVGSASRVTQRGSRDD